MDLDGDSMVGFGISGTTGEGTIQNGGKLQISADVVNAEFATSFLVVGASFNNAQGAGGTGNLTITGADSQVDLTGEGAQVFIGSVFDNLNSAGDGEILVEDSGKLTLTAGFNQMVVGGQGTGAKGLLTVQSRGEVDLGGGDFYVAAAGAGASTRAVIDGAGSILDGISFMGIGRHDTSVAAGAAGRLTVSNGGVVGNVGANIIVGQGGVVSGRNGTLIGDV